MELEETRGSLEKQGLRIAAISYDSKAILKAFAGRRRIGFPLLSDEGSKVIRAFGVLNESIPQNSGAYGVPHPITFVVSPAGKVVSKHFEKDYRERETIGSILTHHFNVKTGFAETVTETAHLKLTASASNAVIRPNQHIRLRLDVELKPKMHVYAPGVMGYKPIAWQISPSSALTAKPPEYPASRMLRLPAIGETVPVFDRTFSTTAEVVIGPPAALKTALNGANEITIDGQFRYQACDDKVCYVPQSVPVQWKLRFEPLDAQRAPVEIQHKLQ